MTTMEQLIYRLFSAALVLSLARAQDPWPVPYKRFDSRPSFNPYCQAGVVPFCPTGNVPNTLPKFYPDDVVEVYALKAPVFEFDFGDLLGLFVPVFQGWAEQGILTASDGLRYHIMHDAMAFNNLNTGKNYTLEWYELVELFNCTFAHVLANDSMIWCNQGAACIYDGVDDKHWTEYGTLIKVAEITGSMYNSFAEWVLWDNHTAIYYETWTVWEQEGGKMWFDSFDCASFVMRAFQELANIGAKFDQSIKLNYTRINLYSDQPQYLGNITEVSQNETLLEEIQNFYKKFQSHQNYKDLLKHLLDAYDEVFVQDKFYLFYNFEYWYLPMKKPFIKLTYTEKPLPPPNGTLYFVPDHAP